MGIPKFFRYIAQRWPLTSQQVNDNVIPEFDNLYLDMNSILHTATHNNAENLGHLSEDQMYLQICNYIEHLFAVIGPKKVFFMAIDGVAPRAKMNQQRARRFRSAMDAEEARRKAASRGEVLDDDPFDSNCITPGTEFMMRLTQRLRYFIARKITEDSRWQSCNVVLSGHEVPGEGEHKIMRYIRNLRSQPDYDHNTRHCLYGLDADLIMLGLSTHEPHFALLREEVTFGRQIRFQSTELSEKRFILLHLSLVREYIQIEFSDSKNVTPPNFERMLDDFILINFFIGNDFLPELPMLMVNEGAIPVILDTYKAYLRESGNKYISHNGVIDFLALKHWMEFLKVYQDRKFAETSQDLTWFNAQLQDISSPENSESIVLTKEQRAVFDEVAPCMIRTMRSGDANASFEITTADTNFLTLLAEQTGFEFADNTLRYQSEKVEPKIARKVIRQYDQALVDDPEKHLDMEQRFTEWKNRYYMRKFDAKFDSEIVTMTARKYLEGLQWVLSYYYRGCPSWSWYYNSHYAPMVTEIISAIGEGFTPSFSEGTPFLPFEQLMAVLPDRSVKLLPPALRPLVLEPNSPIIDFYPHEFAVDKNGKRADWEAVVLIPFIDQDRLLKVVRPIEEQGLTKAEKQRNARGLEYEFQFDPNAATLYPAPSPTLADIPACTCVVKTLTFPARDIRYGLFEDTAMGVNAKAGFPSLYTLPFEWRIARGEGVKVFEMPSRDESVIFDIKPASHSVRVGDRAFVRWPFLIEGRVTQVLAPGSTPPWTRELPRVVEDYDRRGVKVGETEALVRVSELQGLKRLVDGSYSKDFGGDELLVPAQLIVPEVVHEDPRFAERAAEPLSEEFPIDSSVLLLLAKYYGFPAKIIEHKANSVDVEVLAPRYRDPLFAVSRQIADTEKAHIRWSSTDQVARSLGLPVKFLLQLTSRLMVEAQGQSFNITLPLRKHGLGLMAEGYTRLGYRNMWEFSDRGIALLLAYLRKFRDAFNTLRSNFSGLSADVAKEMRDWVRENTEKLAFVPTSTNHLTHQSVAAIEQKVIQMPATHLEKVIVKGIDRGALLSPAKAQHQLRSQGFKLGDRVVSALNFGKVPLYMRGIVVGVNGGGAASASLDVLWDHEFDAGSTLDDRTKTKRGLTVPADSVLNISFAQLTYHQDKQPVQEFVNARVNTRNTPGVMGTSQKPAQHAKKFVPSEVPNAWASASHLKTNESGKQLLQALRGSAHPPQQASTTGAPPPVTGSGSGHKAPVSTAQTSSESSKQFGLKAHNNAFSKPQGAKDHERSADAKRDDSLTGNPSTSEKPTVDAQKKRRPQQPNRSRDSQALPQQARSTQDQNPNRRQKKNDDQQRSQQRVKPQRPQRPKQDQPPSTAAPVASGGPTAPAVPTSETAGKPVDPLVLPEVKGKKPHSAESAKTLLDALMLKN